MNGRVHDPLTGRFLSADPFIPDVEDTQSWNRYSYVNNNPLSFVDPSGFFFKKLFRKIKRFIKKWGGTIISIAFSIAGMPFLGSLLGNAFSTVANGGNFRSFLRGFAIGAVAGAIAGPIGSRLGQVLGLSGSSLAARIAQGALTGGIAGGLASTATGGSFWDGFAGGAVVGGVSAGIFAAFGGKSDASEQPALESSSRFSRTLHAFDARIGGMLGKLWSLPNTVFGFAVGLAGVPFGARIRFGDNAIQFINYPWGRSGALTIGNVVLYHNAMPDDLVRRYDDAGLVRIGTHERAHTLQSQVLGPLFGPAYVFAGGAFTGRSPFEIAADNFAEGAGSWWPWRRGR